MTYKKYNITKPKKDYYQEITDVFIELLETEKGNFVKTWQDNNLNGHLNNGKKKGFKLIKELRQLLLYSFLKLKLKTKKIKKKNLFH